MGWFFSATPHPLNPKENGRHTTWRRWCLPHSGCGRLRKISSSLRFHPRKANSKNCLKVTSKHKTKNGVDKMNNLMKLKYLSSFFPFFLTVWTFLPTDWTCRGLLLHTHTTPTTHIHGWFLLDDESSQKRQDTIFIRQVFMLSAGFEPAIPTIMRPQIHAKGATWNEEQKMLCQS